MCFTPHYTHVDCAADVDTDIYGRYTTLACLHLTRIAFTHTHIYDIGREGRSSENSFGKFGVKLVIELHFMLCMLKYEEKLPKLHVENGRDAHSQILPKK